ncbi:DUF3256 family protein [Bacteroides sp. 224]|uniref:DUF3256 family protein n=1 Tax=Bacteroides sp. 224 TaxID=2302936 RepID=UPI0013D0FEFF|nr:DUF3256 family protein [Bacteroides sp. 224]NDV66326.1 DUF3256 family protein [Bacteroides sp. 224]
MKKILLFLFAFTLFTSAYAQEAKTLFLKSPESVTPLLTEVNRADFIDFLESNMKAKVKNRFESESEMTDLTADYIRIQMTPQSTWEMKVLPVDDAQSIICIISTACAPICDSRIQLYTADWKPLNYNLYITLPKKEDFFLAQPDDTSTEDFRILYKKADLFLVKASLSKESKVLTFSYTTPEYMVKEDAEKLSEYLREPLMYTWNQGKFQKMH